MFNFRGNLENGWRVRQNNLARFNLLLDHNINLKPSGKTLYKL